MNKPTRLFDFPYYQLENFALDLMMTSKVGGEWVSYSTKEFVNKMNLVSKGLLELGVQPGDKVALISHNNRCEWNVMDHGILQIGAIVVPIYPTMTESDYEYILNHSEAKYCFVSNEDLFNKVSAIEDKAINLKGVYTFEEVKGANNWSDVLKLGDKGSQEKVEELKEQVREEHLATIIYTSGTTGLPKGVMLSHKNIATNSSSSTDRVPDMKPRESRSLSFLPVCHVYERMLHYLYMYNGVTIYFADSLETIKEDLMMSKPNIFSAVPRLLEKFYDGISTKGKLAGGVKKLIFEWAEALAFEWQPDGENGSFYEFKLRIADKLVYSKVRAALGLESIKAVASGSAALQPRLAQFFNAIGIPVLEGYGLTETSPVITVNTIRKPNMIKIGYVGKVIADVEVKIAEDGEILSRGPNVMMGYYKDEEKTNEVLKDGWFHTGDIGQIDNEFLKITDRKKEMFKTSGGKYVAPQLLENSLKASHLIEQLMVIGEGRKFPSALIVPSADGVKEYCRRKDIPYTSHPEMLKNEKVVAKIKRDVAKANSEYGSWEQIKKYELLAVPFTIDGGELTPTLKLKRKPIKEKYKDLIESIYA